MPRVVLASLHFIVGVLVWSRAPLQRGGSKLACVAALPGVIAGGGVFLLAPDPERWSSLAQVVFGIGGMFTVVSLCFLGRSFAILPAIRSIIVRGPYRVIRHPVYAGELVMVVGCCLSLSNWLMVGAFALTLALVCLRIHAEERELLREDAYQRYAQQVRFRLLPALW